MADIHLITRRGVVRDQQGEREVVTRSGVVQERPAAAGGGIEVLRRRLEAHA